MKINVVEKKDIFFILILILIAVFGFSFNVKAETLFFDNFDSYTSGQTLTSQNPIWTAYDGNSADVVYSANPYSSNNVVAGGKGNIYNFSPLTNGSVNIYGYISSSATADYVFFIGNRNAQNTNWTNLHGFLINLSYCNNGQILGYNVPYNTYNPIYVNSCSPDTWVRYTAEWYNEDGILFVRFGVNGVFTQYYDLPTSIQSFHSFGIMGSDNSGIILDDFFLSSPAWEPVAGLPACGFDAGKLISTTPANLCDVGTAGTVVFDGSKWSWDCISGAVSQSCRAYLATTEPVNGTCGAWDGETFNTWPPATELCELRSSLVVPSMVETINGYTWTCSGINGGTSDYCSGNKTSPPLMPELPAGSLDDCSGLSILEGLVCNMGNTLKTIFLPSSEKINELNQTINKMSSKFPFSYISKATETFNDVKGNITETSVLELSIMESEKSSIDFSTIAFFDYIKMLTTILIIIVFSFWLIRFIKHIF